MPDTTIGLATSFITFSRPGASGGGATVTDRDGKIKWAGHNLLTNSESFDASAWVKQSITVSANSAAAPNGTTTADKIVSTSGTGEQRIYRNTVIPSDAGIRYTFSVFAKADGANWLVLRDDWSGFGDTSFDLVNGAVGTVASGRTATISALGSGVYLCTISNTVTASYVVGSISMCLADADNGRASFVGNGTKAVVLWGAHWYRSDLGGMQLNPAMGAGMGSYYPTTPRNLLGYTEAFGSWTGNSASVLADSALAPNGLQTADKVYPTSSAGRVTQTAGTYAVKTISVYAKAAEMTVLNIRVPDNAGAAMIYANLATGVTTIGNAAYDPWCTHGAVSVGNGWWRVWLAINANGPSASTVSFAPCDAVGSTASTPSGTNGIYLWGAQLSDSASLDTYVPQYGAAVTSAAYYAPRLDFDPVTLAARGLLVEEQRVNLLAYSEDFTNWSSGGGGTTVTANAAIAPSGAQTADEVIASGANASISRTATVANVIHTLSFWVRSGTQTSFRFGINDGSWITSTASVVSGSGSVSGTGLMTVTGLNTSWTRIVLTTSAAVTAGTAAVFFYPGPSSQTAGDSVIIWGTQLEAGSFATSYIPTGSATATRTADVASVSTQAFPYSASEGTLVASVNVFGLGVGTSSGFVALSGGTSAENIAFFRTSASNNIYWEIRDNSSSQASYTVSMGTQPVRAAIAYAENNSNAALNGTAQTTDTTCTMPTATTLVIGSIYAAGDFPTNGWIRQITYIPRRLSNAELASRTAA